jgi:hypothetical protein
MASDSALATVFRRGMNEVYRVDGPIGIPPGTKVSLPDDPNQYEITARWFDVAEGFVYDLGLPTD